MPLVQYACSNCGHWQPWFAHQHPLFCPVCTDVRNALPEDGWDFVPVDEVGKRLTTSWQEIMPGLVGFSCSPKFGLGATGWLLLRKDGNVAFEGAPYYSRDAIEEIRRLGGIRVLASSHPHGYGALWQLQEAFDPILTVHRDDLRYTKAFRVTWPADDIHELAPGLTMYHTGGHYEGHSILYDQERKAVFCGDALKIDYDKHGDPRAISCHKGFHYEIPLSHSELQKYRNVFSDLPFERAFTPFEHAEGVTRRHALALYDLLLSGQPHTTAVSLEEL
ncbi:MAG: MBL fold metallo-hydrolase [Gemmataceae bacterium]